MTSTWSTWVVNQSVVNVGTHLFTDSGSDKADKTQSSRHIPCAVHLESLQILNSGRHDGACLLLFSAVSAGDATNSCVPGIPAYQHLVAFVPINHGTNPAIRIRDTFSHNSM